MTGADALVVLVPMIKPRGEIFYLGPPGSTNSWQCVCAAERDGLIELVTHSNAKDPAMTRHRPLKHDKRRYRLTGAGIALLKEKGMVTP